MVERDGGLSSSEAGVPVVSWRLSPSSVSFLWPFYGAPAPFPSLFSPSLGPVMQVRMLLLFWLLSPETGLMAPERFIERWRTGVPPWEDSGATLFKNGRSEGMRFQPIQSEGALRCEYFVHYILAPRTSPYVKGMHLVQIKNIAWYCEFKASERNILKGNGGRTDIAPCPNLMSIPWTSPMCQPSAKCENSEWRGCSWNREADWRSSGRAGSSHIVG